MRGRNKKDKKVQDKYKKEYVRRKDGKVIEKVENDFTEQEPAKLTNRSKFGNPNWYFTDKGLAEMASQFSFNDFLGNGELIKGTNNTMPSIMTICLNPSIGNDITYSNKTAAVQMAAKKLYSQLALRSGRTQSYAPQDVMMLVLAFGEIISISAYIRRALGFAMVYNQRNRDYPSNILKAMGINPEDLYANLAPYRMHFNTILASANKIPVLSNISWFEKCDAIYKDVFFDYPDNPMSATYIMVPGSTWVLNEDPSASTVAGAEGSFLQTKACCYDWTTGSTNPRFTVRNLGYYLTLLNEMIGALLTSSTYNVIYGDMINYSDMNKSPRYTFPYLDESYGVVPVYDQEVLLHIHNMMILSAPMTLVLGTAQTSDPESTANTVTPMNSVFTNTRDNMLVYNPVTLLGSHKLDYMDEFDVVDFPTANPDVTARIEATRFATRYDLENSEVIEFAKNNWLTYGALPDHYPILIDVFTNGNMAEYAGTVQHNLASENLSAYYAKMVADFSKFDWAPLLYAVDNAFTKTQYVFGDVNYFTHLNADWVNRINNLTYQALFELR